MWGCSGRPPHVHIGKMQPEASQINISSKSRQLNTNHNNQQTRGFPRTKSILLWSGAGLFGVGDGGGSGCFSLFPQVLDIEGTPHGLIHFLVQHEVLACRTDEFGELEVAARLEKAFWKPLLLCESPMPQLLVAEPGSDVMARSKIELLTMLFRQGFEPQSSVPDAWSAGKPLVLKRQQILSGSKLYFCALVQRDAILCKGATEIFHVAQAKYYRALLTLKSLTAMQAAIADAQSPAIDLEPFFSSENVLSAVPRAIEAPEDPEEHAADFEVVPVLTNSYAASQALIQPFVCPPVASAGNARSVINFDGCSHSSGILRAYIRCCWGHEACFKYRQVNVAGSRERLIAFLFAWQLWGEHRPRDQHTGAGNDPPLRMVDEQFRLLFE